MVRLKPAKHRLATTYIVSHRIDLMYDEKLAMGASQKLVQIIFLYLV